MSNNSTRCQVAIDSQPSADNDYTLKVYLIDAENGAQWCDFTLFLFSQTEDIAPTLAIFDPAKPHIVSVRADSYDGNGTYFVGEGILLAVELSATITSFDAGANGGPYLSLDIQNQDTSEKRAFFVEYEGSTLYFAYAVQPGDFAEDLDLVRNGFVMNGANIQVNGTPLAHAGYRDALPIGAAPGSLSQNSDIAIR
ncbi:MAG: hypothetical protein IK120_03705, partial [Muribaculaceae bacterium]|nr:hypothetical protein [Muribaculaceae bacterium]